MSIPLKRHECRAPEKCQGRCGKRTYFAAGGVRRCGQKAGPFRAGSMEKRVTLGKCGQILGKWTGFSHLQPALTRLFPHKSTQVVDFPHLSRVRVFWEGANNQRGAEIQRGRIYARNLSAFIASFHDLSLFIAQIRAVITHFLAYYRSGPFLIRRTGTNEDMNGNKKTETEDGMCPGNPRLRRRLRDRCRGRRAACREARRGGSERASGRCRSGYSE
jgi:hypothetical protein